MPEVLHYSARTTAQTQQCASRIAPFLLPPMRVFLSGELGAGKTCWVRDVLRSLGQRGVIPSPSYALVFSYQIGNCTVHHLDCFRLQGAPIEEDLLELLHDDALCLLEWPECAHQLPPEDLTIRFDRDENDDTVRHLQLSAYSEKAIVALQALR